MRCPLCEVPMKEIERQGVVIDICPECRGVWLDRGELDKLLAAEGSCGHGEGSRERGHGCQCGGHRHEADRFDGGHGPAHKKKKSWLSELFDFD